MSPPRGVSLSSTHNKVPFLFRVDMDIASAMAEETHCIDGANQARGTGLAVERRWRIDAVDELVKVEVVDTLNASLGYLKRSG
jgi:hypothetical protein